ncbi:tetratricopeptide repeat protein [Acidipila rosea]|uniref:Putative CXXCH cytochrome family protein n=1 Tax=Acidipila rosea TaxID=768535 RepID=A0A4V2PVD1_9BACT|nr:tetratricopeptide repeat protein [Acidipila rosea]TCK73951.1 putative CXXCH cytochrome family protein [Acidipila rosea]
MKIWICALMLLGSLRTWAANPADQSCAKCHQQIYDSYEHTPMARASGPAVEGLIPGEFTHAASGVHYRIFEKDDKAWLSYDRPATKGHALQGEQELRYYIGSGKRGRTYLFDQQGYWFESPINWYAKKQVWDMAPNYLTAKTMPFTMPVDEGCLHCHASGVQQSLEGSRNHFAGAPFSHGGIGCSSCHGDATAHAADGGRSPALNPAKLPAAKRDSICLQCHLEGETSVARLGHRVGEFKAGDNLFDQVVYFVHQQSGPTQRATSQWEALLRSECKRRSGDRMSCATCHDPHHTPAPEERVAYYRSKCLTCHGEAAFVAKHHPEQPDCAGCHMARRKTEDIAHEQLTDHDIQRVPGLALQGSTAAPSQELVTVGGEPATDRDFGLAYAQLATHGNQAAGERAIPLLRKAERTEAGQERDAELHTRLGFLLEMNRQRREAVAEYQAALKADPLESTAAGDLAVLMAEAGDFQSAQRLWSSVFEKDPSQTAAGYDLAVADCKLGDARSALATLDRLMIFSPDNPAAAQLRLGIASGRQSCSAR